MGYAAGSENLTGQRNTFIGSLSALNLSSGNQNTFIGRESGRYISSGDALTAASNCTYIGYSTRASVNSVLNEIAIGHSAIGQGSNSVVLGNDLIAKTILKGQVIMGSFASAPTGIEGAIYYDSTTKKHYGFDGTTWNALY